MRKEIKLFKELRLVLCSWCFNIALKLAPKNDDEGLIVIETVQQWASKMIVHTQRGERT